MQSKFGLLQKVPYSQKCLLGALPATFWVAQLTLYTFATKHFWSKSSNDWDACLKQAHIQMRSAVKHTLGL